MENSKTEKLVEAVANTTENAVSDLEDSKTIANSTSKEKDANSLISITKLTNVGCHIGLAPSKWNPKMKPYIYTKKTNNHIIDVVKILVFLKRAYVFLESITQKGGKVLIIGTRGKIVKDLIAEEAKRSQSYFVTQRWLGGTLTNFKIIKKSISKMNDNLQSIQVGSIEQYTKKEQLKIRNETDKLVKFYGGIRTMRRLPSALIVLDPVHDKNAILEARKLNIPIVAFANTNADPSLIDYIVPMNNNSVKSIGLILNILIDAICQVNGEPTKVIGVPEDQIVLLEQPQKKYYQRSSLNHRYYNKRNTKEN